MSATFLVTYKPGPGWYPDVMNDVIMQQHASFVFEQHRLGTLLIAGPQPEAAGAVAVVRADSAQAVDALLGTDPALTNDLFQVDEIRPFRMVVGPEGRPT